MQQSTQEALAGSPVSTSVDPKAVAALQQRIARFRSSGAADDKPYTYHR
ncbi:hypothetical protein POF50_021950 [Streptomyces sp. SL13]|uniref:Uncharacterized protein n=1 Tax=Streptantibioticus silvisoli TaxID=2705255 RepID=A0AA90JZD6_9ACTN|nr:hypothetical protein [Streptantibioticus silvisoli]MDI5966070.1 hypothetical protein [Streptantibioticus silvisoli]MDI5971966.1 hypothetical protein [Streptantibioticus silvisoli]